MKFIKSQKWLFDHFRDTDVRIVDCRFTLSNPSAGSDEYKQGHIPGAVYFDLKNDLSGVANKHGGRHPLPEISLLKDKLEKAGIDNQTTIVAYDDGDGSYAGRFWWLLSYMGHEHVFILDNGLRGWIEAHNPVDTRIPSYTQKEFRLNMQPAMLASYEEVAQIVEKGGATLIDSRAKNRYLGLEEPIDKEPGHIPGAINKVWEEGIVDGTWKPIEEQIVRFRDIDPSKPVVVYCGSGVTATPNVLALKEAGFQQVKLYAGSYSDWVSYDENKVEIGECK